MAFLVYALKERYNKRGRANNAQKKLFVGGLNLTYIEEATDTKSDVGFPVKKPEKKVNKLLFAIPACFD